MDKIAGSFDLYASSPEAERTMLELAKENASLKAELRQLGRGTLGRGRNTVGRGRGAPEAASVSADLKATLAAVSQKLVEAEGRAADAEARAIASAAASRGSMDDTALSELTRKLAEAEARAADAEARALAVPRIATESILGALDRIEAEVAAIRAQVGAGGAVRVDPAVDRDSAAGELAALREANAQLQLQLRQADAEAQQELAALRDANVRLQAQADARTEPCDTAAPTVDDAVPIAAVAAAAAAVAVAAPMRAVASPLASPAVLRSRAGSSAAPGQTLKRVRDRMGGGRSTAVSRQLFVIKGRNRVRAVAVELSPVSVTNGDVFVLETETHLMTFVCEGASRHKVAKAVDITKKIARKRGNAIPTQLVTYVSNEGDSSPFWNELGLSAAPSTLPVGEPDAEWEQQLIDRSSLYLVDEQTLSLSKVEGRLTRELLDTNACYVFDSPTEIYVWMGKKSGAKYRNDALVEAQHLLEDPGNRPDWLVVQRMTENAELALFEDKFASWPDEMAKIIGKVATGGVSTKTQQVLPRILEMLEGAVRPEAQPTQELDGHMEVCHIRDFKRQPLPSAPVHVFVSTECYACLYVTPSSARVYYFWIGADASQTQQGGASSLTKQWLDADGKGGNLVRVEQGKEPSVFLNAFGGRLLVLKSMEPPQTRMIHLRGTVAGDTRCMECPVHAAYLNSDDCFVVTTATESFVWRGEHAGDFIVSAALEVASFLMPSPAATCVGEDSEPALFWSAVGGASPHSRHVEYAAPPRFFLCANINKTLSALLQPYCAQRDLTHKNMAMLDLYNHVFLWFGCDVALADKILLAEVALDYLAKASRNVACSVWTLDECDEVLEFTRHFQSWDPALCETRRKNAPPRAVPCFASFPLPTADALLGKRDLKFSLKELSDRDFLPEGVDAKQLERFLRDEDFPEVFSMTAEEFWALPSWKRTEVKKGSVLF